MSKMEISNHFYKNLALLSAAYFCSLKAIF